MSTTTPANSSWKKFFLSLASDPHYTGCSISSIKSASLTFSTQEKLRFLESDPNLVLLSDDDGNSLLAFHHFHMMSSPRDPHDQKLVAIAGFDHLATPVIINIASIKNYSQVIPKWKILQNLSTTSDLQNKDLELETTSLRNAIIIPIPILRVILSSPEQSPATLAILILNELKRLDSINSAISSTDLTNHENLQHDETKTPSYSYESFMDNCGYIVQWLTLAASSRIKPVRYSLARSPEFIQWFNSQKLTLSNKEFILNDITTFHENIQNKSFNQASPESMKLPGKFSPINKNFSTSTENNIQQLTVSTLIEMKESLEAARIRAERKDEKKERGFHKLPTHRKLMILNASSQPPFTEAADTPTEFYETLLAEKSAFKVKQLVDHELSNTNVKRFKISPALAASLWIGDLISDEINPSNLSIWFCPERSHVDAKESELERGLWIMDGKHVRSDIQILSKTSIYVPDGVMDAYFMLLNFRAIIQLIFGQGCEIDIFLTEWLDHIFTNRELYIIQQDDDRTFLAQVLHCINQATHLYLESCSRNQRVDVRDNLLSHEDKRDLIEQRNFTHKLPSAIKSIFQSTDNDKDTSNEGQNGNRNKGGKRKSDDDGKQIGKRIDNKIKDLQKFKLKPKESFQPFYDKARDCPKFDEGLPCMKFLLKGHCHTKCNRMHNLSKDQEKEFEKFINNVKESIKQENLDFQRGAAAADP